MQLNEGKDIGVAHANILIINEQAIGEDINSVLDYFIRNRDIGYLTIATTPNSAKEMLEISANSSSDKETFRYRRRISPAACYPTAVCSAETGLAEGNSLEETSSEASSSRIANVLIFSGKPERAS